MHYALFRQIVSLEQFGDEADALAMANATRCGFSICQSRRLDSDTIVFFVPCVI